MTAYVADLNTQITLADVEIEMLVHDPAGADTTLKLEAVGKGRFQRYVSNTLREGSYTLKLVATGYHDCTTERFTRQGVRCGAGVGGGGPVQPDLPLASATSDIIRWSRVLLSHTLDTARSY